jgi:hypothetical protein
VRDPLRRLQERERLVQLAAVHPRPRLGLQRAQREVREARGEDRQLAEGCDDVVVALVAQRDLGAGDASLEQVELVVAEDVRDGRKDEIVQAGERRRLVHAFR